MTNLTDVNIKELLAKSDTDLRAALEAMLPKPYPERLLGRWAKHPEHGDVLIGDDVPIDSCVVVIVRDSGRAAGSSRKYVALSSLTFPEQTTRPEDVPVGEAWLVNVDNGKCSGERVVALKYAGNEWRTGIGAVNGTSWWEDGEVTLITPLVPATPAQEPEPEPEPDHPATLSSVEDYQAAPAGTVVAEPGGWACTKRSGGDWYKVKTWLTDREMADTERQVLRKGWG